MSDKTRLIFLSIGGASLGILLGFGGLMLGLMEPAVEVAGEQGLLGAVAVFGAMLGMLVARAWRSGVGEQRGEELSVEPVEPEFGRKEAVSAQPTEEPQANMDPPEMEESEEAIEDHGSLFDEMDASPEVGEAGYQPSFQSVVFAMGGEDEEEIVDMRAVDATKKAAEEARRIEEESQADPGFSALASAMGGSSPEGAKREGSVDVQSAQDREQPQADPGFSALASAMGGSSSGDQEKQQQEAADQATDGGFGELMSSMGAQSEKQRMKEVGTKDRVIASGAKSNPLAGATRGDASPDGPGQFEVVGGSEDISTNVDALRDALNQPSEPDPLADDEASLQSDRPAASGVGLEENTSPNALRNNLLAARMRRREQRSRPKRQLLQSRQGVEPQEKDERDETAPGYRPGRVNQQEDRPTPEQSEPRADQERQMTKNLKPAMNILRKPSNQEAGIDSRDGDLGVPEPKDDGRVMTVRIDNASQRELLSDTGE